VSRKLRNATILGRPRMTPLKLAESAAFFGEQVEAKSARVRRIGSIRREFHHGVVRAQASFKSFGPAGGEKINSTDSSKMCEGESNKTTCGPLRRSLWNPR